MTRPQYYNEHDEYAAQWIRNLIAAGHVPAGDVDTRSIIDVPPEDLQPYDQCHFFAGIAVWPYALRRAGLGGRSGLWSGSCPCQPFSAAGQQLGFDDERHLWPAWFHLITQRRPAIVVGEQVSSALAWLDLVRDDLESAGYAVGAADLCAPGFPVANWNESPSHEWLLRALYDCPDPLVAAELLDFAAFAGGNLGAHDGDHIRQRLYFVGLAEPESERGGARFCHSEPRGAGRDIAGNARGMGDAGNSGPQGRGGAERDSLGPVGQAAARGAVVGMADDRRGGREMARLDDRGGRAEGGERKASLIGVRGASDGTDAVDERRGAADWLFGRDGRWRPVESGSFPLANAPASRVGRLRAYGNALDAETVVAFLNSVRECAP